ncbi:hypothetical protein D3C78_1730000 [compost metagenome]
MPAPLGGSTSLRAEMENFTYAVMRTEIQLTIWMHCLYLNNPHQKQPANLQAVSDDVRYRNGQECPPELEKTIS